MAGPKMDISGCRVKWSVCLVFLFPSSPLRLNVFVVLLVVQLIEVGSILN